MADDEAFNSNTMSGLLAYTVPSAIDIFSNTKKTYTYYDFNDLTLPSANGRATGQNLLNFEVSVQNGEGTLACTSKFGNCRVRYDEVYTPQYTDTIPNQVTYGMTINMVMNANRCHYALPVDWDPFYYLKIGKTLTEWEGLIDSGKRLPDWIINPVTTVVGKNPPSKSVDPDVNFSMFGKPRLMESSRHCSFDGTECWRIRVHPKIDSISAAQGYLQGGQTLIIKGWGLKGQASTSVVIDGVTCIIDEVRTTDEQIVCETGSKATVSAVGPQPGQPGITYNFVNPTDANAIPDWLNSLDNTYPKTKKLWTSLDTLWNSDDEKAVHVLSGWFKAPATGRYRFYMQADDQYKLYLDTANPYNAASPVPASPVEIGQQWYFNGWR